MLLITDGPATQGQDPGRCAALRYGLSRADALCDEAGGGFPSTPIDCVLCQAGDMQAAHRFWTPGRRVTDGTLGLMRPKDWA